MWVNLEEKMSATLENYNPFTDDSGTINDWLYEDDTCAFCDEPRTKDCQQDEHGWVCPKCHQYNFNGSGRNNPEGFDRD